MRGSVGVGQFGWSFSPAEGCYCCRKTSLTREYGSALLTLTSTSCFEYFVFVVQYFLGRYEAVKVQGTTEMHLQKNFWHEHGEIN